MVCFHYYSFTFPILTGAFAFMAKTAGFSDIIFEHQNNSFFLSFFLCFYAFFYRTPGRVRQKNKKNIKISRLFSVDAFWFDSKIFFGIFSVAYEVSTNGWWCIIIFHCSSIFPFHPFPGDLAVSLCSRYCVTSSNNCTAGIIFRGARKRASFQY